MDITNAISFIVGILGTVIAIWQAAQLREKSKRAQEMQYLLAGISNATLSKYQSWANQITVLVQLNKEPNPEIIKTYFMARDDFSELHTLVSALEGVIDSKNSAIIDLTRKQIEQSELNNKLQALALKNPANPPVPNTTAAN